MLKKLMACCMLGLLSIGIAYPVAAKTISQSNVNLNDRLTSLESKWGRFQLGGNLTFESLYDLDKSADSSFASLDYQQELNLYLNAYIQDNLNFTLRLNHLGGWGVSYASLGSSYPMTTPLQIEEAYLSLEYPNMLNYLGRFSFSPSPLGLVTDFSTNKVEGLALQKTIDNYHLIGIFSRINTEYESGSSQVTNSENYLAGRIGWSNQNTILGLNLIPDGITGEKAFSFDFSRSDSKASLSAEFGWYSFNSSEYPDYQVDWTSGALLSYGYSLSKTTFIQGKAGWINPQFTPSHSSLAHSSGTNREWFLPNSKGVELLLQNNLKTNLVLENRLIYSIPIENYDQPDHTYHWQPSIRKYFSPTNQLVLGYDLEKDFFGTEQQLFLNWNLNF